MVRGHDDAERLTATESELLAPARSSSELVLTVLAHREIGRIGEVARIRQRGTVEVSRLVPDFVDPERQSPLPLSEQRVSRSPIHLVWSDRPLIERATCRTSVRVQGEPLDERRELRHEELESGVVVQIAGAVTLCVRVAPEQKERGPSRVGEIVGESEAIARLRYEIDRLAGASDPVLVLGETGTGKELVARRLHQASGRRAQPFLSVNLAAIPAELAASELFGTTEGAFTGARRARQGIFRTAHGGTVFLDEVAAAPLEVQAALLRVLESGEVQAVGSATLARTDVRVVAATDEDLERAVTEGTFRAPLFHRLAGYRIELPPLRERREDTGRLMRHFLLEKARLCASADLAPFLAAPLVERFALAAWPGNVRQLRQVVAAVWLASDGHAPVMLPGWVERELEARSFEAGTRVQTASARRATVAGPPVAAKEAKRSLRGISDTELVDCLRRNAFRMRAAARELGVARSSLYARVRRKGLVRDPASVTLAEIVELAAQGQRTVADLAAALEVSPEALEERLLRLDVELDRASGEVLLD